MTGTDAGAGQKRAEAFVVLRCRIGVRVAEGHGDTAFESALADGIAAAATDLGATVELLQLAVALDPSWALAGPPNRC